MIFKTKLRHAGGNSKALRVNSTASRARGHGGILSDKSWVGPTHVMSVTTWQARYLLQIYIARNGLPAPL